MLGWEWELSNLFLQLPSIFFVRKVIPLECSIFICLHCLNDHRLNVIVFHNFPATHFYQVRYLTLKYRFI